MSEVLKRILNVYPTRPATAILMSGQGSNAETLLADPRVRENFDVRLLFSDKTTSRAAELAGRFGVACEILPVGRFADDVERPASAPGCWWVAAENAGSNCPKASWATFGSKRPNTLISHIGN